MYLILLISCICFGTYGLGMVIDTNLDNNIASGLPTMIANICCIIISCITLGYKFANMRRAKLHKMTELEY
jgi:uncharacterized protein with PQ loop repeat